MGMVYSLLWVMLRIYIINSSFKAFGPKDHWVRTLNYGNYGAYSLMGIAGFISSPVSLRLVCGLGIRAYSLEAPYTLPLWN